MGEGEKKSRMGEWANGGGGERGENRKRQWKRGRWSKGDVGFTFVAPSPTPRFAVSALLTAPHPEFASLRDPERSPRSSVAAPFPGRRLRGWMICNGPY